MTCIRVGIQFHKIDTFISRVRFLTLSRAFTICKFYFDLLIWKGIWGLFDNVIGAPMPVSLTAMIGGMAVLAPLGAIRAVMCTPCGLGFDRPDTYISVPMFLKVPRAIVMYVNERAMAR